MAEINTALLNDFIDESREHLDEMESLLLNLAEDLENLEILNDIFRTMHNVKGTSQLTGLDRIARLSHRLEDLLDLLRRGELQTNIEMVDLMILGRDRIVMLVSELESSQQELSSVDELIDEVNVLLEVDEPGSPEEEIENHHSMQQGEDTELSNPDLVDSEIINPVFGMTAEYDEKNDEELFNIFSENLKVHFSLICETSLCFKQSSVNEENLRECWLAMHRIKSSANYMGYDEVVFSFESWRNVLEDAQVSVSRDEDVLPHVLDECIEYLISTFPQLQTIHRAYFGDIQEYPENHADDGNNDNDISSTVFDIFNQEEDDLAETRVDPSLLDDFIGETKESYGELEELLLLLGDGVGSVDALNTMFRIIHNIQGASQLIGVENLSTFTHLMEDLLDMLRHGKLLLNKSITDILGASYSHMVLLVDELESTQQDFPPDEVLVEALISLIDEASTLQEINSSNEESSIQIAGLTSFVDFEQENDHELFSIFIEHLQEQFNSLVSCVKSLEVGTDQEEVLANCLDAINRMYSSANYMGYIELKNFYEKWSSELAVTTLEIFHDEDVPMDFMNAYLDVLLDSFPQLEDIRTVGVRITPEGNDVNIIADKIDVSVISELVENNEEMMQDELHQRLSSVLDSTLKDVSRSEYDALNEVFDELVSSKPDKVTSAAKQDAIDLKSKSKKSQKKEAEKPLDSGTVSKSREVSKKKIRKSIRIDADKIDTLMNQVGELVVDRSYFFQLFNEIRDFQQHLKDTIGIDQREVKLIRTFTYRLGEAISALGRTSNELQEGVMKMRMLPVSHLFNRYPRLVHDLTSNIEKNVELILRGEETELDRMIVEELSDPLIHIIRNAIDHGIESIEERVRKGKEESGQLILEAYQESNHIVIEITDDGRGLSPEKIKKKAVSSNIYSEDEVERLGEREVLNLILMPGFSTADKITSTSGRGVGMDVVKRNIESLNGTLDIDSRQGKGTQIRLKIPLTLAIIHALMIRVGKDILTIPLTNVDETVRIKDEDTSIVEGVEVIYLRGVALPIFRLSTLFKVSSDNDLEKSFVVIVNTDGQRIGFVVDELLGQEEVVIKPLEDYVQEKSGFSGATIVGDGRISLIIDVYELVKMTTHMQVLRNKEQAGIMKLTKPPMSEGSGMTSDRLH